MPDIESGLTVDGEDAGIDSDAAFNEALSRAAQKSAEPATPAEPETRTDPSVETADDIRSGLLDPSISTDVIKDGLSFKGDEPPKPHEVDPAHLELGQKLNAKESERAQAERDELAALRFERSWESPYATEETRLAAAMQLAEESPRLYAEWIDRLDDESILEQLDLDPDGLEDAPTAGWLIDQEVSRAQAILRAALAQDVTDTLRAKVIEEQTNALNEAYAAQGLQGQALIAQAAEDFALMREEGFDVDSMSPAALKGVIERMAAGRTVADRQMRVNAFKASMLAEEDGSVSGGLETMTAWGLMKYTPQPSGYSEPWHDDPERFQKLLEAELSKKKGRAKPLTVGEFKRSFLEPEPTSWANALTQNGKPVDVDTATGAKERAEQTRREELARIRAASGR